MAIVTEANQYGQIINVSNLSYIKRHFKAMSEDTTATFTEITEAAFSHVYFNVWQVLDENHTRFFLNHFQL